MKVKVRVKARKIMGMLVYLENDKFVGVSRKKDFYKIFGKKKGEAHYRDFVLVYNRHIVDFYSQLQSTDRKLFAKWLTKNEMIKSEWRVIYEE